MVLVVPLVNQWGRIMKTLNYIITFLLIVTIISCSKKNNTNNETPAIVETMEELVVDQSFDWSAGLKGELVVSFENPHNASVEREYLSIVNQRNEVVARRKIENGIAVFNLNLPEDAQYYLNFPVTEDQVQITKAGSYTMELGPTTTNETKRYKSVSEVESCTTCDSPIENAGGELPYRGSGWGLYHEDAVPGWETTASDNKIEIWTDGFLGVQAQEGRQFFELNANLVAALYQELCLEPGSTIKWSVNHRGRSGVDVADVRIGGTVLGAEIVQIMSDGNTEWGYYEGTYTVPEDQETTFFVFNSVSASGGSQSVGNLLDNFEISCDYDGDGISDENDQDPENPDVAFVSYFPSSGKQVVAFEDLWPNKGDYDFNDIVLSNQVKINMDQDFALLSAEFAVSIDAIGAGLDNGIAMMIYKADGTGFPESIIESVTGDAAIDEEVTNGIILTEDVFEFTNERYQNNGIGVTAVPDTLKFTVVFNTNAEEFLPELYIFRTDDRSHEVHRSEFSPTSVANSDLFNQGDNSGNYKTVNGLPWGLEIFTDGYFKNPIEKVEILEAYPEFEVWATSGGEQNKTWYTKPVDSKVVDIIGLK